MTYTLPLKSQGPLWKRGWKGSKSWMWKEGLKIPSSQWTYWHWVHRGQVFLIVSYGGGKGPWGPTTHCRLIGNWKILWRDIWHQLCTQQWAHQVQGIGCKLRSIQPWWNSGRHQLKETKRWKKLIWRSSGEVERYGRGGWMELTITEMHSARA